MTPEELAKVLSRVSGSSITAETIARHVAAGAPADDGGRIALFQYAAWLNRELHGRP